MLVRKRELVEINNELINEIREAHFIGEFCRAKNFNPQQMSRILNNKTIISEALYNKIIEGLTDFVKQYRI